MERGGLVTLVAGVALLGGLFGAAPAAAAEAAATLEKTRDGTTAEHPSLHDVEVRSTVQGEVRLVDPVRLASDPATSGRRRFDYLAWLPTPESKTQELDPMLVIRQVVGRRLVSSDDFSLIFMRGRHLLAADLGSTHIGIAPTSFSSPTQGTIFTVAGVF
jgi:hypothetical protein